MRGSVAANSVLVAPHPILWPCSSALAQVSQLAGRPHAVFHSPGVDTTPAEFVGKCVVCFGGGARKPAGGAAPGSLPSSRGGHGACRECFATACELQQGMHGLTGEAILGVADWRRLQSPGSPTVQSRDQHERSRPRTVSTNIAMHQRCARCQCTTLNPFSECQPPEQPTK